MKKDRLLAIIFFISWLGSLSVGAQEVKEKRITMEFKNERLSSAFKRLENVSGYKILFVYEDVNQYTVDGKVKNHTIEQVLKFMVGDQTFKIPYRRAICEHYSPKKRAGKDCGKSEGNGCFRRRTVCRLSEHQSM